VNDFPLQKSFDVSLSVHNSRARDTISSREEFTRFTARRALTTPDGGFD
jgi:hypothetical protein